MWKFNLHFLIIFLFLGRWQLPEAPPRGSRSSTPTLDLHKPPSLRVQAHQSDDVCRLPQRRYRLVRRGQWRAAGVRVRRGVAARRGDVVGVWVCPAQRPWGVLQGESVPGLDQWQATDCTVSVNEQKTLWLRQRWRQNSYSLFKNRFCRNMTLRLQ